MTRSSTLSVVNSVLEVESGDHTISPTVAKHILETCYYEPQRKRTETGELFVERWAEIIKTNLWQDYSQIHFAGVGDDLYLINGYHRLHGVIAAGVPATFNVRVVDCETLDEVHHLYANFDHKAIVRHRSDQQALDVVGFNETLDVSKTIAKAVYNAVPIIKNGLTPILALDTKTKIYIGMFERRIKDATKFKNEAKSWEIIVSYATGKLKQKLMTPAITAIALVLLREQGNAAAAFWVNVAKNSGLVKGQPEHFLVTSLLESSGKKSNDWLMKVCACAWNAAYDGQKRNKLNPNGMKIVYLKGTSYSRDRYDD